MPKMQPVAMIVPNSEGIYTPSRLMKSKIISEQEFLNEYADSAKSIKVSYESDGVSNPYNETAYGYGFGWYIIVG